MKRRKVEATALTNGIDTRPLRALASTGTSHALRRPDDRLLTLTPISFVPLVGGLFGLVILLVGGGIYLTSGHPGGLFVGGIGAVFALAFLLIVLTARRFEFDRERGLIRVRRLGLRRCYPLERVRAIQLVPGGWHGSGTRPKFFTYQLNVVFDDADRPRMNLTNHSNWEATWRAGSALAEFLGVPLLDEVSGS